MLNAQDLMLEFRKPNYQERAYRKYIDKVSHMYPERDILLARVTTLSFSNKDLKGKDLLEEVEKHFKESISQGKRLFR